jgi:VCBS repeat-containing protein
VLTDGSVITVRDQFAGGGVENVVFGDGRVLDRNGITADLLDRAPVAADVTLPTIAEDAPSFVVSFADLLANASDVDLDALTVSAVSNLVGGTAEIVAGGIRFTPGANYNGPASFTFTVDDGRGGTTQASATFAVTAVEDAPVVAPAAATTVEDAPVTGQIVATDADGDALTFAIKGDGAAHGTVTIDANGHWSYAPAADYNGADSFTVLVSDGHVTTESTVSLTINPVNDAPVAVADAASVGENDTAVFNLTANDTDVENGHPSLTGFHVTGVSGIALNPDAVSAAFSIVDGQLKYNPGMLFDGLNDGQHATVSISYTAEDSDHAQTTGQFVLTVNGVTDVQVITGTNQADTLLGGSGADNISAGDGDDTIYTGDGVDTVDGGKGSDFVFAGNGVKTINGGDGDDYLFGGSGNSTIAGGNGNDLIMGGSGAEMLKGGAGNDLIYAGTGNDTLAGGAGNDLLYGGAGQNTFVFSFGGGHDTVMSFQASGAAHDFIQIDAHEFANFAALTRSCGFTDTAAGAVITYHDGSSMTFAGIHTADLGIDDFRFI